MLVRINCTYYVKNAMNNTTKGRPVNKLWLSQLVLVYGLSPLVLGRNNHIRCYVMTVVNLTRRRGLSGIIFRDELYHLKGEFYHLKKGWRLIMAAWETWSMRNERQIPTITHNGIRLTSLGLLKGKFHIGVLTWHMDWGIFLPILTPKLNLNH